MNKLALSAALLPMMALALTGCVDDTQPRLGAPAPESFKLYEPALNNYEYCLSADANIVLTTNGQPDYGVATPTQYQVQISLTNDWSGGAYDRDQEQDLSKIYYNITTINTQSVISVRGAEFAAAMCALMGIKEADDEPLFNPASRPVWVRVAAYVLDPKDPKGYVDYSYVVSNVIELKQVRPYFVVPKPGEIFIIGKYQGWNEKGNDQTVALIETGIGTKIFQGYVEMTPEAANEGFRFYTELGDWGKDGELPSIGANANDGDNMEVELDDDTYEGDAVKGKGNWKVTNFPGGWMQITLNQKSSPWTVTFKYDPDYTPPTE